MATVEEILDDDFFESKSKIETILFFVGCISFICCCTFVLIHMGFVDTMTNHNPNPKQFLTRNELWLTNLILGGLGGLFLCPRTPILSITSGLLSATAITGTTIFYLDWRTSIMVVEIIIPLGLGIIPGVILYQKVMKRRKKDKINISNVG